MSQYVIIGGGIIGTTIGLALSKKNAGQVTILEKESSLGCHASGRNSGVIHSGINQKPGSLKARMCVEGSRRLRDYCREKKIPMVQCGTLVVARNKIEIDILERLLKMGRECGVENLSIVNQHELQTKEPLAQGIAALFSPNGATVDSLALLVSLADEARQSGVQIYLSNKVVGIDGNSIITSKGKYKADHIINCAGLYTDKIAHMMDAGKDYRIVPFRGEYMEVKNCNVRGMIYQPPDLRFPFLSIHLTRETDGRVLAGPSAVLAFGREAYNKEWNMSEMFELFTSGQFIRLLLNPSFIQTAFENAKTSISKQAFLKQVQSLAGGIRPSDITPCRAGIRAQMVDSHGKLVDDLLVEYQQHSTHILNAVSPGMTSSLAFADYVVEKMLAR